MIKYPFIMQKTHFTVAKRASQKNNQLRAAGLIPANMYQAGKDSVALQFSQTDFNRLYRTLGDNAIIYLQIDGAKTEYPVLIDDVQYDALGKAILHVVFRKVNLSEKINAYITVETSGEFKVPNGVLVMVKDAIEVEALPTDLPEKFVIDLEKFTNIGDQVTLADLSIDLDKVSLVLAEDEKAEDVVIALAQEKAEEVEEESTELVEPELVGEKKTEESDVATEQSKE